MFSFLSNTGGTQFQASYPLFCKQYAPSTLGYATNNQYAGFPPKMVDGRALIASYQPEAVVNNDLIVSNGIRTNWEYRRFLTKNAKMVIDTNFRESANDVGYYKRVYSAPPVQYNKRLYDTYDIENGDQMSDLKMEYLSREQLAARQGL
jgi:hypothetical protein